MNCGHFYTLNVLSFNPHNPHVTDEETEAWYDLCKGIQRVEVR